MESSVSIITLVCNAIHNPFYVAGKITGVRKRKNLQNIKMSTHLGGDILSLKKKKLI